MGNRALKIEFHNLFNLCTDPNVSVEDVLKDDEWNLQFKKTLVQQEVEEWNRLINLLENVRLSEGRNVTLWLLENEKRYTPKSLYRMMTFGGESDLIMMEVWRCKVPLKIQIFLWMVFHDRIQSATQLKKKKWTGSKECKMCGVIEITNHIMFCCPIAAFL